MGKNVPICLSPIQPNTPGIIKVKERRDHNDIGGTNMAIASMVFSSSEHVYPQSIFITTSERPTSRPIRKTSSFSSKPNSKTGGLVGSQKSLASKGISDKAAKLISDSRRGSSISSYESASRQLAGWCGKREVDPFQCPLKFVLDYLSDLFEKGLAYRTINVYRSAISAYHEPLHGSPIGGSPLVCSLLNGVFNLRPPQPRYPFIRDIEKVLCYLISLPVHKNLSDKELTLKLTMMLALTATSRCSETSYLNINFMAKTEGKYIFSFNKLTKVCRRSKSQSTLSFHEFEQDKSLCGVSLLDTYTERSKPWRQDQQKGQLLLSFVKPHNEVVKSTISEWIKEVIKQSGINVEHFKAHSTKSASSYKVQISGLPVEQILKRGNWLSKSTWQKYYNKNIEEDETFEQAVFENVGKL